jgi:hypothetical protein
VNPSEKPPLQRRLEQTNWILLAALSAPAFLLFTQGFAFGILCGGLISVVNFHWLCRNLFSVFRKDPGRAKRIVLGGYAFRLLVTGVVLLGIIASGRIDIIGLLLGLSIVPLNLILTTIHMIVTKKNCCEGVG